MKYRNSVLAMATASLLALPLVSLADSSATSTPTVTVGINLFVDGGQATADSPSANGASFPMSATWSAKNINYGSGTYPLGPTGFNSATPYMAVTSEMTQHAYYHTHELVSFAPNALVSTNCYDGAQYQLQGYTIGNSLSDAAAGTPSLMGNWPGTYDVASNTTMIVWNTHCLSQPVNTFPKNGTATSSASLTHLDWTPVTDPYGTVRYYYEASLSASTTDDRSFVTPIATRGPLSSATVVAGGSPNATYYWHVKAVDDKGNSSGWSSPFKVIVK